MKTLKEYIIPFSSLKNGENRFSYKLNNTFFEAFNWDEFEKCEFDVELLLIKSTTMLDMYFTINGAFTSPCDRCMHSVDLKVNQEYRQLVKLVENDLEIHNDEIEFLSLKSFEINVSPYIFEFCLLSLPSKKAHALEDCNKKSIHVLDRYLLTESQQTPISSTTATEIDPRWEKLKELKNKKDK